MVAVDMRVPQSMHKISRFETRRLRHHRGEKRVGGDIERHAEEQVRASLIKLARELAVADIKLKYRVARRRSGLFALYQTGEIGHIPTADNDAPGIRIAADSLLNFSYLVDSFAVLALPRRPLFAVNRA